VPSDARPDCTHVLVLSCRFVKDKDGKGGKVVKTTGSLDAKSRYCPVTNSYSGVVLPACLLNSNKRLSQALKPVLCTGVESPPGHTLRALLLSLHQCRVVARSKHHVSIWIFTAGHFMRPSLCLVCGCCLLGCHAYLQIFATSLIMSLTGLYFGYVTQTQKWFL